MLYFQFRLKWGKDKDRVLLKHKNTVRKRPVWFRHHLHWAEVYASTVNVHNLFFFFLSSIYGFSPISARSLAAVPVWQRIWWKSKITNLQNEFSGCITPFSSIGAGLRVLGEKWTVRVVTCSLFDRFSELLILGWHDPVYAPGALLVTHCNFGCWEITGAGRPGRHSQLGGAPPVRWGHSAATEWHLNLPPKNVGFS